ncbi:putative E3 ubiquitin-protein ligase RING1a isoform X2 [Dioscorea cayenensis subsp. rotundata]|uniref:E3 ubiquitin-protein ligase RING1a isoform X2 n=1 Tax=Dioscorea cayennensis subsp. rotundata TaxID=55577 RepID=A0AB40BZC1_DIOCR|nr:putative E3 ubiquitin-protein ligase RING1a isoform X2 [Dioscorea cayenensis subsp. rotundata]
MLPHPPLPLLIHRRRLPCRSSPERKTFPSVAPPPVDQLPETPQVKEESDADDGSASSPSEAGNDEFIMVKLSEIRKEVQCPICLGIIRKTRTVMECLHRFCRECIDKSMRLGNNECPACRTHCASRRSLRDDPNYDSLISALYPDIDKYEEEELAFHDEEKTRNKKIQASIAETFRRQTEALGRKRSTAKATAVAFVRRSNYRNAHGQSNYLRGRSRTGGRDTSLVCSDDEEEEDVNGNDGCKDSSSADERSPDVRPKRCKRWSGPRSSPARTSANADIGSEENDDLEVSRETMGTSPLIAGNGEMLAWGKNGARSQTRHGNASGSTGRFIKGGRMSKMVEFLRNLDEKDAEFDLHVTLLPLDETLGPQLEQPYLCCRPTLSVRHLSQFIALQLSVQAEQVDIFIKKPHDCASGINSSNFEDKLQSNPSEDNQILSADESLAGLHASFSFQQGDLVLVYRLKLPNQPTA